MQIFSNAFLWIEGKWTHFPQSILVDSGRISEIFEPRQALPANTSIHDLKGHYLYPGFTDTHTHSFEGGLYSLGADLSACGDIAEVLAKLDAAYQKADKEDIIFAWQLDVEQPISTPGLFFSNAKFHQQFVASNALLVSQFCQSL